MEFTDLCFQTAEPAFFNPEPENYIGREDGKTSTLLCTDVSFPPPRLTGINKAERKKNTPWKGGIRKRFSFFGSNVFSSDFGY